MGWKLFFKILLTAVLVTLVKAQEGPNDNPDSVDDTKKRSTTENPIAEEVLGDAASERSVGTVDNYYYLDNDYYRDNQYPVYEDESSSITADYEIITEAESAAGLTTESSTIAANTDETGSNSGQINIMPMATTAKDDPMPETTPIPREETTSPTEAQTEQIPTSTSGTQFDTEATVTETEAPVFTTTTTSAEPLTETVTEVDATEPTISIAVTSTTTTVEHSTVAVIEVVATEQSLSIAETSTTTDEHSTEAVTEEVSTEPFHSTVKKSATKTNSTDVDSEPVLETIVGNLGDILANTDSSSPNPRVPRQQEPEVAPAPAADAPAPAADAPAPVAIEVDPGQAAAGAQGGDGEIEGRIYSIDEEEECEESWSYIEFLRSKVNMKVEESLESLRDTATDADSVGRIISDTMKQILSVRESVHDRIFQIRKDEVKICLEQNIQQEEMLSKIRMEIMGLLLSLVEKEGDSVDNLKDVRDNLLSLRMNINTEVMRVLMLPQTTVTRQVEAPAPGECEECAFLQTLSDMMENLKTCAEKDAAAVSGDGGDATAPVTLTGEEGSGLEGGEEDCPAPAMYFMEILATNQIIDAETKRIFPQLFDIEVEEERKALEDNLNRIKEVREDLEDVITKLSKTKEDSKKRQIVSRGLDSPARAIMDQLMECKAQCGPGGCDSCAATVIYEIIDRMSFHKEQYQLAENGDDSTRNEDLRRDVMSLLATNKKDEQEILAKSIEGPLDNCDQEKMTMYNRTTNPLWMLVNTTIFADGIAEPQTMVSALIEILQDLLKDYCADDGSKSKPAQNADGPSCEWEEYVQTGDYIEKIDMIIQDALFKPKDDSAKKTAQLGLVEVKMMLDKRVEQLFVDNLVCSEEASYIKTMWMSDLNKCMALLMNNKLRFSQMSRSERIACTKDLRGKMESRRSDLIQREVERSLEAITEEGGSGGEPVY